MDGDRLPAHATPYTGAPPYPASDTAYHSPMPQSQPQNPPYPQNESPALAHPTTAHVVSPYQPQPQSRYSPRSDEISLAGKVEPHEQGEPVGKPKKKKLSKKWQKRLCWMIPLAILSIVLLILFEVYKDDFSRWVQPLANWLKDRDAWSWVIPVSILFLMSFPPLFGHEIVMLIVGLTYPLAVGVGIACAGAVLGEAGCFIAFKYFGTSWVNKKIAQNVKWAATARVSQEAGFRGVLIIRYSIVPPHLANPLFACTGMAFWLYMITVILSLPKTIIFVILAAPAIENSTPAKIGKGIAIGILVVITVLASIWIRRKSALAIKQIEAERAGAGGDEMYEMLSAPGQTGVGGIGSPPKYGKLSTVSDVEMGPRPGTLGAPSPAQSGISGISSPGFRSSQRSQFGSMDSTGDLGAYGSTVPEDTTDYGRTAGRPGAYRTISSQSETMRQLVDSQGTPRPPHIDAAMSPPSGSSPGRVPAQLQPGGQSKPYRQEHDLSNSSRRQYGTTNDLRPPNNGFPGQAF